MIKYFINLFSKKPDYNSTADTPFDLEQFNTAKDIKLFALSTCIHCRMSMQLLDECGAKYYCVYVDKLVGDKREAVIAEVKKYNPSVSFPTVVINNSVVVGFHADKLKKAMEKEFQAKKAPTKAEQLYKTLKKLQEAKGYCFNADMNYTMPLMESLLTNKQRYGYMTCPCRLANGSVDADRDIICPCVYREPDLEEYNACFCGLYVTKEYNENEVERLTVPERRAPEKIIS